MLFYFLINSNTSVVCNSISTTENKESENWIFLKQDRTSILKTPGTTKGNDKFSEYGYEYLKGRGNFSQSELGKA